MADDQEVVPIFEESFVDEHLDFDRLEDNDEELTISIENDARKLRVRFDSDLCYRSIDEGDHLRFLEVLNRPSVGGSVFFEVTNSEFMRWYVEQGCNIKAGMHLRHIAIVTNDTIFDIICSDLPVVEELAKG